MPVFARRKLTGATLALAVAGLLAGAGALAASFPTPALTQTRAAPAPARIPFGVGERATYRVKLGGLGVGQGSIEVLGRETIRGQQTLHTRMTLRGRALVVGVNDVFESWIDTDGLFSRRFHQNQREARFRRNRTYEFYPEQRTWRRENGETGTLPTDKPLDDLSFLFYARTLPLVVGQTYTVRQYFKADGNPVTFQVLRKETVEVPAGRFRTIVVRPVIQTDGLFGEDGRAEVYFSDDDRRILVLIRSRVSVIGSLSLHLTSYRPPS